MKKEGIFLCLSALVIILCIPYVFGDTIHLVSSDFNGNNLEETTISSYSDATVSVRIVAEDVTHYPDGGSWRVQQYEPLVIFYEQTDEGYTEKLVVRQQPDVLTTTKITKKSIHDKDASIGDIFTAEGESYIMLLLILVILLSATIVFVGSYYISQIYNE